MKGLHILYNNLTKTNNNSLFVNGLLPPPHQNQLSYSDLSIFRSFVSPRIFHSFLTRSFQNQMSVVIFFPYILFRCAEIFFVQFNSNFFII